MDNNFNNQGYYQQPNFNQPALPMKWYKFLIYFVLFASAVVNAIAGFSYITGGQYGDYKELVYKVFPALKGVDVIYGLAALAIAALAIYTRMRLAGYYKNGPQLLNTLYIAAISVSLVYLIIVTIVINSSQNITEFEAPSSSYASIAVSAAILIANSTYFKKRAHLFTK